MSAFFGFLPSIDRVPMLFRGILLGLDFILEEQRRWSSFSKLSIRSSSSSPPCSIIKHVSLSYMISMSLNRIM
jgi:hypothetical protein